MADSGEMSLAGLRPFEAESFRRGQIDFDHETAKRTNDHYDRVDREYEAWARQEQQEAEMEDVFARGFWGRLKWAILGR